MKHQDLRVLATHTDQLSRGERRDVQHLQAPPEQRQEILSFLQLAEQVRDALAPVRPSTAYKRKLGLELAEMARRRRSRDLLIATPSPRREWIIAVALAGGIAYLVRTYMQGRSQHVSQVRT